MVITLSYFKWLAEGNRLMKTMLDFRRLILDPHSRYQESSVQHQKVTLTSNALEGERKCQAE